MKKLLAFMFAAMLLGMVFPLLGAVKYDPILGAIREEDAGGGGGGATASTTNYINTQDQANSNSLKGMYQAADVVVSNGARGQMTALDAALSNALKSIAQSYDTANSNSLKGMYQAADVIVSNGAAGQMAALDIVVSNGAVGYTDAKVSALGSNAWEVASPSGAVQFNDGGVHGGTNLFLYDKATRTLSAPTVSISRVVFPSGSGMTDVVGVASTPILTNGAPSAAIGSVTVTVHLVVNGTNVMQDLTNRATYAWILAQSYLSSESDPVWSGVSNLYTLSKDPAVSQSTLAFSAESNVTFEANVGMNDADIIRGRLYHPALYTNGWDQTAIFSLYTRNDQSPTNVIYRANANVSATYFTVAANAGTNIFTIHDPSQFFAGSLVYMTGGTSEFGRIASVVSNTVTMQSMLVADHVISNGFNRVYEYGGFGVYDAMSSNLVWGDVTLTATNTRTLINWFEYKR